MNTKLIVLSPSSPHFATKKIGVTSQDDVLRLLLTTMSLPICSGVW
ncbi:MAG: hypothetical protein ACOCWB_07470 [Bacteroidota bacterium]